MIFTLDSGVSARNASGVAVFAGRDLLATTVIRRDKTLDGIAAHYQIASEAIAWLLARGFLPRVEVFATEWPQAYPGSNIDPNKALMPLCGVIGAVSGLLPATVVRVSYLPREWKGTIDGDTMVRRIQERLSPSERVLLNAVMPAGLRHNAADAIGIGLKYLGRLERHRVIHNEA